MIVSDSCIVLSDVVFFFFQAEDGIRDVAVTGVQTCALPIALRFPRYATSTSCVVRGRNSSRNQARALRNTGSRRRSYSLSSRSALSYLVVMGGSVGMTIRKLWGYLRGGEPGPPGLLRRAHAQLLLVADQRHPEEQGLQRELVEPAVFREQRRLETELREALRLAVDQGRHPELLREAPQLAERRGTLVQVHEMTFDAPFGKEPEGGARGGALFDPEDLDFHSAPSGKPHRAEVHQSLERLVQPGPWQTGSPRELLEGAFTVGQLDHRRHALIALRDRDPSVRRPRHEQLRATFGRRRHVRPGLEQLG